MSLPPRTRLCFIADGRSPIARNWIAHFVARGHEVHLVSTFPCGGDGLGLASLHVVPVAFARFAGGHVSANGGARRPVGGVRGMGRRIRARAVSAAFPTVFGWLAPVDLARHVRRVRELVRSIDPDLVHALRIPFEGIVAAEALRGTGYPLVLSVWGNDLELWAARYPLVGRLTRRALPRAQALHPDCARDLELARAWGWNASRASDVIPGNGGVRGEVFHRGPANPALAERFGLPADGPLVLNARGFRAYVRSDTFFRSIPLVLGRRPDAVFACVGMADDPRALRWIRDLGVESAVRLVPRVDPGEMADLFRRATVSVSPSEFDGTPNTLLESMACGALPVSGDIVSVREWVRDGVNGLLFDPADPEAMANATVRGLNDEALRLRAGERNAELVRTRAEYTGSMARAEALYVAAMRAAPARAVPTDGGAA